MPVIKREESPEAPIANIAPAVYSGKSSFFSQAFSKPRANIDQDVKPPLPPSSSLSSSSRTVASQAHVAAGAVKSNQSSRYSWLSSQNNLVAAPLPNLAAFAGRLSSQRRPAVATAHVNKTTKSMTRTTTSTKPPTLHQPSLDSRLAKYTGIATAQDAKMEGANHADSVEERDQDLSAFPPMDTNRKHCSVTSSLRRTNGTQKSSRSRSHERSLRSFSTLYSFCRVRTLQARRKVSPGPRVKRMFGCEKLSALIADRIESVASSNFTRHASFASQELTEDLVREQDGVIRELVSFNQRFHRRTEDLHRRLITVEISKTSGARQAEQIGSAMYRGAGDARSRSPSPTGRDYRDREEPLSSRKVRGRKPLQIQVPGKLQVFVPPAGAGLPTPNTSFTVRP